MSCEKWWIGYPWRLIQTNLSDMDFNGLDPKRFVSSLLDFNITVLMLNVGGISAHYKSEFPWHVKNPWADENVISSIVDLCHMNGIRVIARTDFSKVRKSLYLEHPEWAFRAKDGSPMIYNDFVQTCINSDYQQKYALKILEEIFTLFPFDGLYCNMGGFQTKDYDFRDYGFCHCNNCRKKYREMYGRELPEKEDHDDINYLTYKKFQSEVILSYRKGIVAFLKKISEKTGRSICYDDEDYARIEASTELHRKLPHWQYQASSNCRAIIGSGENEIICSDASVDYMGYAFRHVAVSPWLQKLREWQNLANLGGLDYFIMGRVDNHEDRNGFSAIKEVFRFHHGHENLFQGLRNAADVLLHRNDRWVATEEEKGWIRVLTENHIPFAEMLPEEYEHADLSKYRSIILPDSFCLSEAEALNTERYVKDGGNLIITGRTAYIQEKDPEVRKPSSLSVERLLSCQGISKIKETRRDIASAAFRLRENDKKIFLSYPDTDLIAVGDRYIYMVPEEGTKGLLQMIPKHAYGPPECCYYTEVSDYPALWIHAVGKAKVITIPWYPGELFARTGFDNPEKFMRDVLISLCGCVSIAPELTDMVEVTVSEKARKYTMVQLVNGSGIFGMSFTKPVEISNLDLRIVTKYSVRSAESLMHGNVQILQSIPESGLFVTRIRLDHLGEYDAVVLRY